MRPALTAPAVLIALSFCVSTAAAQTPGDAGTFQAAVSYQAGMIPWSAAAGDFNGDGAADLAVVNLGSAVSVLLGGGDGSFQAPVRYRAGWYPASLTVGDLTGDGIDDLIVGSISDEIDVLAGLGDGTFGAPTVLEGCARPLSFAVGDLDGDFVPDLVVATGSSSGVSVRLGAGAGTFRAAAAYGGGSYPTAVAIGDFNGDQLADLAVSSDAGAGINLLAGNGDGTFQEAVRLSSSTRTSLVVGDFNGDGRPDLAAAGQLAPGVGVLLGNGDGTFQAERAYGPDLIPTAIAVGDVNGDGRDDLAVTTYEARSKTGLLSRGHLAVLVSDGATLLPAAHYGAGTNPRGVALVHADGDGKIDLAAANGGSADVSVLLNGPVTTTGTMHVSRTRPYARVEVDPARWRVELLVRAEDDHHVPLAGTIINGSWSDGTTGSCVTDAFGLCAVTRPHIPATTLAITFTVTGLSNPTHPEYAYEPSHNHDTTGYGDGTTVTVARPW